jgi:hypothetical protein
MDCNYRSCAFSLVCLTNPPHTVSAALSDKEIRRQDLEAMSFFAIRCAQCDTVAVMKLAIEEAGRSWNLVQVSKVSTNDGNHVGTDCQVPSLSGYNHFCMGCSAMLPHERRRR